MLAAEMLVYDPDMLILDETGFDRRNVLRHCAYTGKASCVAQATGQTKAFPECCNAYNLPNSKRYYQTRG